MMRQKVAYLSHTAGRQEPPSSVPKRIQEKGSPTPPGDPFSAFRAPSASSAAQRRTGSVELMSVAFIDLDRTLLRRASGKALNRALRDEGVVTVTRSIPGEDLLFGFYDRFGENALSMALARGAAVVAKGWDREQVRAAGRRAVPELLELIAPFAPQHLAALRAAGHKIVLATTTPRDLIEGLTEALGFDDVIATSYEVDAEGRFSGRINGGFVWGLGKLRAVARWADEQGVDLADCHAFSDSVFDTPLLSSVGFPHAVNPDPRLHLLAFARRWPIEHWDRPAGVPSLLGLEPYHLLRPFIRTQMFPYARFDISGVEKVPDSGPLILVANHRSYFDVAALAIIAAEIGRPVRALAKRELFDAPLISQAARSLGAICVDRDNAPERAFSEAIAALHAGEAIIILPEGTIPRGRKFFDPVLEGKTGAARLAMLTDATVVPIGVWGTEAVWPRSSKLPNVTTLLHPPTVSISVGSPISLKREDAVVDTEVIMAAISAQLPEQARRQVDPTDEQLASTYPSGEIPASDDGEVD